MQAELEKKPQDPLHLEALSTLITHSVHTIKLISLLYLSETPAVPQMKKALQKKVCV